MQALITSWRRSECRYGLDDFTDDDLSPNDHAWLDSVTQERAFDFAARHGYDLKDYIHGGWVSDWWGFTWMILAEARGVLTPENRAAAWRKYDVKLMAETNVVGVISGRGADRAPQPKAQSFVDKADSPPALARPLYVTRCGEAVGTRLELAWPAHVPVPTFGPLSDALPPDPASSRSISSRNFGTTFS